MRPDFINNSLYSVNGWCRRCFQGEKLSVISQCTKKAIHQKKRHEIFQVQCALQLLMA